MKTFIARDEELSKNKVYFANQVNVLPLHDNPSEKPHFPGSLRGAEEGQTRRKKHYQGL